jgi:hypothetical protein
MLSYAGIGSRSTPSDILSVMQRLASWLGARQFVLRSGGAVGADSAFALGASGFSSEIFRPEHVSPDDAAHVLAASFHPVWPTLGAYVKALHARNGLIVLGSDLASPVSFVVCWTPSGSGSGGTGQALRIARSRSIPIFDLAVSSPRSVCEHALTLL